MNYTNFEEVTKFIGKVNKTIYGVNPYAELEPMFDREADDNEASRERENENEEIKELVDSKSF